MSVTFCSAATPAGFLTTTGRRRWLVPSPLGACPQHRTVVSSSTAQLLEPEVSIWTMPSRGVWPSTRLRTRSPAAPQSPA